jgi:hypothetical protein
MTIQLFWHFIPAVKINPIVFSLFILVTGMGKALMESIKSAEKTKTVQL